MQVRAAEPQFEIRPQGPSQSTQINIDAPAFIGAIFKQWQMPEVLDYFAHVVWGFLCFPRKEISFFLGENSLRDCEDQLLHDHCFQLLKALEEDY